MLVTTANDAPPAPTSLSVTAIDDNSMRLNWASSFPDPHATQPYEAFLNGVSKGFTANHYFDFTGLVQATTYTLEVRSKDVVGAYSALKAKTTGKTANLAPPAPTGVAATAPAYNSTKLTWNAVSIPDFRGYQLWVNNGYIGEVTGTSYTRAASASTTYTYEIRTVDDSGAVSGIISDTIKTPPNPDTTPPADAKLTDFKPEGSYGRLVVRFTLPSTSDLHSYIIQRSVEYADWDNVGGWVNDNPGASRAVVVGDWGNSEIRVAVRVGVRDEEDNQAFSAALIYWLAPSPWEIYPTGGGSFRNGAWRTDSIGDGNTVMHGRTSTGENYGLWFYGEQLGNFCTEKGRTVTDLSIDYYRVDDQGSSAEIQPMFWLHKSTSRSGGIAFGDGGAIGVNRLGPGVARNTGQGQTGARWAMNHNLMDAISTTWKGIGIYRSTNTTEDSNAASFYMKLGAAGTTGGSPSRTSGKVWVYHLG